MGELVFARLGYLLRFNPATLSSLRPGWRRRFFDKPNGKTNCHQDDEEDDPDAQQAGERPKQICQHDLPFLWDSLITVFKLNLSFRSCFDLKQIFWLYCMKRIILLRHGKAEEREFGGEDINRSLDERGRSQSQNVGLELRAKGVVVDQVLCSTAVRTRQTCEIVCEVLGLPLSRVVYQDSLYLAEPFELMALACGLPDSVKTVLIVGHNPGLSELAALFSRRIGLLGTAGMAMLDFEMKAWPDLASHPVPAHVDWSDKLA